MTEHLAAQKGLLEFKDKWDSFLKNQVAAFMSFLAIV